MTAKADIELVRRQNRALILHELRRRGPTARTVLAEATGLSSATVSSITGEMLEEGVLRRAETAAARAAGRGRPLTPLAIAPDHAAFLIIGIWVGKIVFALYDHCGALVASREAPPIDPDSPAPALARGLRDAARAFVADHPAEAARLASIRVAVQGVTDGAGRELLWSPIATCEHVELADALEREFGRPAALLNDCAAMAEALHWRDPDRYSSDFAVVLIGYGVGMGLFLQGRPFSGQAMSAAEFGHMNHLPGGAPCRCGRLGCVEAYAADYGVWRSAAAGAPGTGSAAARLLPVSPERMAALAADARDGDPRARAAYAEAGRALGFGLGRVFALIGAVRVAFVGHGARAFDLLEDGIRSGLRESLVDALSGALDAEAFEDSETLALDGAVQTALADHDRSGGGAPRPEPDIGVRDDARSGAGA